jgi:membrane-associated phospholipid phosphatase
MPDLWFITNFGDQAVLLPLAIAVGLVFASSGWWRGAVAWTVAIGSTLALMLAFKLNYALCGRLAMGTFLNNPSGHTAGATAVYGGLFAILARFTTRLAYWPLPCAVLIAVVIGTSRLILDMHSGPEVVAGGAAGLCGALAAARLAGAPPAHLRIRRVAVLALLVLVAFHGLHMPADAAIKRLAFYVWQPSQANCAEPAGALAALSPSN